MLCLSVGLKLAVESFSHIFVMMRFSACAKFIMCFHCQSDFH